MFFGYLNFSEKLERQKAQSERHLAPLLCLEFQTVVKQALGSLPLALANLLKYQNE
jgi:hypothetical protein